MTDTLKLRIVTPPALKLKMLGTFPLNVVAAKFLTITRTAVKYTIDVDYTLLNPGPISDPTTAYVAVLDLTSVSYRSVALASLLASSLQITQTITAAGPAAVSANSGVVLVNQTVGASITLTMPLASAKTCPVLISDYKGDAGTNNITISLTGTDKFPGGLTSWTLAGNRASVRLTPVSGIGYTIG